MVNAVAFALRKLMNIGAGDLAHATIASAWWGALIRPYLSKLTRSELFMLMTVGLASVARLVFFLYATS